MLERHRGLLGGLPEARSSPLARPTQGFRHSAAQRPLTWGPGGLEAQSTRTGQDRQAVAAEGLAWCRWQHRTFIRF